MKLGIRLRQSNFENLTQNFAPNYQRLFHIHWNAFSSFIPCVSNALRIKQQLRNGSGFHRVTLPGILFINIRCQSRLEGNNRYGLL